MSATPFHIAYNHRKCRYAIIQSGEVVRWFRRGTVLQHVERILGQYLVKWFEARKDDGTHATETNRPVQHRACERQA